MNSTVLCSLTGMRSTLAFIMAMTGRAAYCDELEGDGVATLRERC
jgi:hypothetical protein